LLETRQHETSERLFCLDVLGTIEVLEEKEKIELDFKEKLLGICLEKSILYLSRKPVSVEDVMQKIGFSELAIRNKISQLVKKKKPEKIKGKPFKVIGINR